MEMRKISFYIMISIGMVLVSVITGCSGGSKNDRGATYTPGQSIVNTVGSVNFTMNYAPAAVSFPTNTDTTTTTDSSSGSVNSPYWVGETEVTYQLWYAVYTWATSASRGANIYTFQNPGQEGTGGTIGAVPIESVQPAVRFTWRDAMVWCNALTEYYNMQNNPDLACVYTYNGSVIRDSRNTNSTACDNAVANSSAKGFRLPTSEEWELAARYQGSDNSNSAILMGGLYWTPGNYASGATGSSDADTAVVAVVNQPVTGTAAVKSKNANRLGLYDMSGNVSEWCFTIAPGTAIYRLRRGGSYYDGPQSAKVGSVVSTNPDGPFINAAMRLVRTQ